MTEVRDLIETRLLGVRVHASSFERALGYLAEQVAAREPGFVINANVYSVLLAGEQPELHACFERAGMVIADGMPIVWSLRKLGFSAERVHGDDLMLACCERFPSFRHYLLGGRAGQPEAVARELLRRIPSLQIVGLRATPERPPSATEDARILAELESARPDLVWVGMGTPTQDIWMRTHAVVAGHLMVGVGSAFDLLSGRTRPAPVWMKRCGLQWAFRLGQEPRRLAGRYLRYNPRFVARVSLELLQRRPRA